MKQKYKYKCKYKSFITFFFFEYVINMFVKNISKQNNGGSCQRKEDSQQSLKQK